MHNVGNSDVSAIVLCGTPKVDHFNYTWYITISTSVTSRIIFFKVFIHNIFCKASIEPAELEWKGLDLCIYSSGMYSCNIFCTASSRRFLFHSVYVQPGCDYIGLDRLC